VAAVAAIAAAALRKVRRLVSMAVLLWFTALDSFPPLAEVAALGKPPTAYSDLLLLPRSRGHSAHNDRRGSLGSPRTDRHPSQTQRDRQAAALEGPAAGRPIAGRGYVELVGYGE